MAFRASDSIVLAIQALQTEQALGRSGTFPNNIREVVEMRRQFDNTLDPFHVSIMSENKGLMLKAEFQGDHGPYS